ncbi:MAG TPA: cobalamin biosynthesis protein CobD [Candidatus Choladocola avistercoris]|nr:cobalamin biosynthesis protein CobD [Candidatus Choladocola avistercoris]
MELSILAVVLGFVLDLLIGDPHWLYHPIRLVGALISALEKLLRGVFPKNKNGELTAGVFLLALTAGITTGCAWGLLYLAGRIHPWVRFALETVMCYQLLATKALKDETMKVYTALSQGNLKQAKYAVSMVVGRDTEVLDETGVTKAAVETVAENASDGVIAPLLFLAIGGAPLGFFYKAVNTMDSMVGYKNDKYLYFGRAAARFDDVLNYIPARLSGALMSAAASFCGLDAGNAWKIFLRDRRNHSSPNSAHTEAAAAGALHIQLAGNAYYFGKLYEKPTIGDPDRPVEYEDIRRVNRLLYATAVLTLIVFMVVKGVVLWIV